MYSMTAQNDKRTNFINFLDQWKEGGKQGYYWAKKKGINGNGFLRKFGVPTHTHTQCYKSKGTICGFSLWIYYPPSPTSKILPILPQILFRGSLWLVTEGYSLILSVCFTGKPWFILSHNFFLIFDILLFFLKLGTMEWDIDNIFKSCSNWFIN